MASAIIKRNAYPWLRRALSMLRRPGIAAAFISFFPVVASADDWGCQVFLCLADPRGPEAQAECVPPVEKLWKALAHGDAFPSCDLSTSTTDIPEDARNLLPADAFTAVQGTSASNTWASSDYCREDLLAWSGQDQSTLVCRASGAINVEIDNSLYTRVWWNEGGGGTVNEFYGAGSTAVDYDPTQSAQKFLDQQSLINNSSSGGGGGG